MTLMLYLTSQIVKFLYTLTTLITVPIKINKKKSLNVVVQIGIIAQYLLYRSFIDTRLGRLSFFIYDFDGNIGVSCLPLRINRNISAYKNICLEKKVLFY